jgi:hypothetical protein
MKVLAITRAERYSPHSVDKDRAILEAVTHRLLDKGCEVSIIGEDVVGGIAPDLILTMGRRPETLAWLKTVDAEVINSPEGVENCTRSRFQTIMERIGTPMPPKEGAEGYWLKRGDAVAQERGDVVFAPDNEELEAAVRRMQQRGITDYQVSAHVVGDLVKFYGVLGTGFFYVCYPTDDGGSKFGDELRNGPARHYAFSRPSLQYEAERLAEAVGVEVYGGDAIVRADGSFCLIDFNDWPSFSRCREQAADAITGLVKSE